MLDDRRRAAWTRLPPRWWTLTRFRLGRLHGSPCARRRAGPAYHQTPSITTRTRDAAVRAFLAQRGHARAARLGELVDPLDYPALISEAEDGHLLGVLTYVVDRDQCEILTLHTAEQWQGVGTALVEAVERLATRQGCRRLWLIATNDNLDGLRFYQRRGFRLAALHPGAVNDSRARLKPEIPTVGDYGIPLRDEVELDKQL